VGEPKFSDQLCEASEFKFSIEGEENNLCRSFNSISGVVAGLIRFGLLFVGLIVILESESLDPVSRVPARKDRTQSHNDSPPDLISSI
jgi:hypothetical protein